MMFYSRFVSVSFILALQGNNPVEAYGRVGHWLSGRIAEAFLSPEASKMVSELLVAFEGSLAKAATWADG